MYVVHKKQISIPNLVFALLHFIFNIFFNNVYLMVTNWCVGFLILIYEKEDSALPINSILSKVHVNDNAHCFAAAKIEQFFPVVIVYQTT